MIKLKPYSKESFIHRSEVDLVQGKFKQFVESGGMKLPPKAILFRGERGFGKTWLCFHIHRTVLPEISSSIISLYMALFPLPEEYDLGKGEWVLPKTGVPEEACRNLVIWICDQLQISYPKEPTLIEARQMLVEGVEAKVKESGALVLILDSVFEADWELLEIVEHNMIAPLAEIPNVFFIMTGRGRSYPWISPALRTAMKEETLGNFPIEQLTKENKTIADLSGGNPLVAYVLLQVDDPVAALDEVVGYLLDVVPPSSIERRYARNAFEALCVLDEFREVEMEKMLEAYYQFKGESIPQKSIRDLRDDLLKTYLFQWRGGGFRLDISLRNVLRNYLIYHQPDLWIHLNCTAYQIYRLYAQKYSQYRIEYEKLAEPYRKTLNNNGVLAECEKTMATEQLA